MEAEIAVPFPTAAEVAASATPSPHSSKESSLGGSGSESATSETTVGGVSSSMVTETFFSWWIVHGDDRRVKLACVNWVSHLEPVVAEGLSKRSMDDISHMILSMDFNCVRLTWPLFLTTNESLASLTVRQSFLSLELEESVSGIQAKNPDIVDLSLTQANNPGENVE